MAEKCVRHLEQAKLMLDYFLEQEQLFVPPNQSSSSIALTPSSSALLLKDGNAVHRVKPTEIMYCEAHDHFTRIHTTLGGSIMTCEALSVWEERLRAFGFVRIHRSFVVNLGYVVRREKVQQQNVVCLSCPEGTPTKQKELPVARRQYQAFKEALALWQKHSRQ